MSVLLDGANNEVNNHYNGVCVRLFVGSFVCVKTSTTISVLSFPDDMSAFRAIAISHRGNAFILLDVVYVLLRANNQVNTHHCGIYVRLFCFYICAQFQ